MRRKADVFIYVLCVTWTLFFMVINVTIINKDKFDDLSRTQEVINLSLFAFQDYKLHNWQCSENNILNQAKRFQHLLCENKGWSACYANDYLTKLYLADLNSTQASNKLFFDVGANKGYTIASWLSTWMPEIGIDQKNLYDYLSQVLKINDCGVCSDCTEKKQSNLQKSEHFDISVKIYAFEPVQSTYEILLQVRTWFNISTLYIYQLAISNTTGITSISKCPPGGEGCGLMSVGRVVPNETTFKIQTMTLDDFVEQKKIKQKIDLLKIDTEGADPLVLQGANNLLSRGHIRMLIFENHEIGVWKTTGLLEVIESLGNKGYICYMLGKTGLARLTDCWSPVFAVKFWSNVLCVYQQEYRLRSLLDELLITKM